MGYDNAGLIILEGADAVGKTTLAKHILDGDESGYIHLSYDPNWAEPDRMLWSLQYTSLRIASNRASKGKLTVIDRHWMTEQIYARVYRGGSKISPECRQWDRVIQRLCGVYVLCAPHASSVANRYARSCEERDEMYPNDDKMAGVGAGFRSLYEGNPANQDDDYAGLITRMGGMRDRSDAILYDIDKHGDNLRQMSIEIKMLMRARRLTQYQPALEHDNENFLGHPESAEFIFVGERVNPKKVGPWPFVDYGASSRALAQVLHGLNFDERRAMWTNAFASDEHIVDLHDRYPNLRVVAFGGEAICRLDELRIPCAKLVHPSYALRFGKLDLLKEQIKEVL